VIYNFQHKAAKNSSISSAHMYMYRKYWFNFFTFKRYSSCVKIPLKSDSRMKIKAFCFFLFEFSLRNTIIADTCFQTEELRHLFSVMTLVKSYFSRKVNFTPPFFANVLGIGLTETNPPKMPIWIMSTIYQQQRNTWYSANSYNSWSVRYGIC
jgi:hypothetical protein